MINTKRKRIVIKNNFFTNGDTCIRIKGMSKRKGSIEELDIYIENNDFSTIRGNGIHIDKIHPGRMELKKNRFSTFNTIALRLMDCRASKDDIYIQDNSFTNVYQIGICVDSSLVTIMNNNFNSSVCGVFVYLQASNGYTSSAGRDEILDSHKDIYYRDYKDTCKESFIGASQTYLQANGSILGNETFSPTYPCRVIMKNNIFKDISKSGVIIQNNSSGSIKVEECQFINVKEPVVINEKEDYMSRHNTTKNILINDNSELYAPSMGTPRGQLKGTIVVKLNKYDGAPHCIVRKQVNSYLYDIDNRPSGCK